MESVELRKLNFSNNPAELLINELHTLERGGFKSLYLLLGKYLKSHFRDEQVRSQRACIPDGGFKVFICQSIKRVDLQECLIEHLIENIVEAATTHQFSCRFLDKTSLYEFTIGRGEFGYDIENQLAFIKTVRVFFEQLERLELFLLREKQGSDLRSDFRQVLFYVIHNNLVQGVDQIGDT